MRAPGMTMFRMPIFTWNILVTSMLVLMAFPVLAAALFALGADRRFGAHVFDPGNGGPMLWQHLFWFFGHPEVYIIALPFFGIITEILPVFSRKPVFGYKALVFATIAIAALSVSVWAHHMYATGEVLLPFFALMTMLIAVPTGVKFFNWIGTMWGGTLSLRHAAALVALGFLVTFLFGGLTGVILASPRTGLPPDRLVLRRRALPLHRLRHRRLRDVRRVLLLVAQVHRAGCSTRGSGKVHFWMLFIGFHTTFLIQHWLGVDGMPRRYADYLPEDGFTLANQVSTVGAFLLGASMLPFLYNVWKTWQTAPWSRPTTLGLRRIARVGDLLPAAAAQLHLHPADPVRAPGVRPPPPGVRSGTHPRRHDSRQGDRRGVRTRAPTGDAESTSMMNETKIFGDHLGLLLRRQRHLRGRTGFGEPVGGVALFLCGGLGLMIAYFLWVTGRKLPSRPEDNPGAEIDEQEGEYGVFSPYSWWPLWLGATAAVCFLGLAVGWWLFIIGAAFGIFALVGWTFESYSGRNAL